MPKQRVLGKESLSLEFVPCSFQFLGLRQGYEESPTEMSLSIRLWIVDFFTVTLLSMILILIDQSLEAGLDLYYKDCASQWRQLSRFPLKGSRPGGCSEVLTHEKSVSPRRFRCVEDIVLQQSQGLKSSLALDPKHQECIPSHKLW